MFHVQFWFSISYFSKKHKIQNTFLHIFKHFYTCVSDFFWVYTCVSGFFIGLHMCKWIFLVYTCVSGFFLTYTFLHILTHPYAFRYIVVFLVHAFLQWHHMICFPILQNDCGPMDCISSCISCNELTRDKHVIDSKVRPTGSHAYIILWSIKNILLGFMFHQGK